MKANIDFFPNFQQKHLYQYHMLLRRNKKTIYPITHVSNGIFTIQDDKWDFGYYA